MSNSSTLYTYELSDFTVWDAANNHTPQTPAYKISFIRHLQWEADRFVFPYINILLVLNVHPTMPNLLRAVIGRFSRYQTGTITAEEFHDEFIEHCSPNNPALRFNHRVVSNYRYDWWKDRFELLGLELPVLNMQEVMEMTQDHFEQLPMGAMLVPGPEVTGQVEGDALFNQIVAVRAHLQHLGEEMASLLEQKNQIVTGAMSTMRELEAPIAELEEALVNSGRQFVVKE
ncbi:hypothetical protein EV424DRAFT_1544016 [Suillus variegatus]|nr:hypothetical protein EV424DRAFT_1544016 [Suillus variegatus]